MYLVKTPALIKPLYRDCCWNISTNEPVIYLTFDDGPHPTITGEVLELLDHYHAKATFFVVGENVEAHPELIAKLVDEGHAIGNHTYNHLNGWDTDDTVYYTNIEKTAALIQTDLFRPPYGKATKGQIKRLKSDYKIIMWDVLSGDFDTSITKRACLNNVINNAKEGSIVVYHDSEKARRNMLYSLLGCLKHFSEKGFRFEILTTAIT